MRGAYADRMRKADSCENAGNWIDIAREVTPEPKKSIRGGVIARRTGLRQTRAAGLTTSGSARRLAIDLMASRSRAMRACWLGPSDHVPVTTAVEV